MSKDNQDKMLALMSKAEEQGYRLGCEKTLESLNVQPITEEQAEGDGIPEHNIEPLHVRKYLDLINPDGYKQSDYSVIWPILLSSDIDSGKDEQNYPYCVYGKGDKLIVECDDEPSQTITPYKEVFAIYCLTPNKIYRWKMYSGTEVIKEGTFKTVGRMRWMKTSKTKYPHNLRDLGCSADCTTTGKGIKFGRLYRGEHPDNIEVGSTDHLYLRDQLGISMQLNLRNPKDDPARNDLFDVTYSINIPAYSAAITTNTSYNTALKNAFVTLVNELEAGRNILINCWQGRDRTGTFCWLIQALCGMKTGYCEAHWEMSSFDRCENSKVWNWEEASNGELKTFIKKLESLYGSDTYTQAYNLLTKKVGVPKERIEKLKEIMCV